MVSSTCCPRRQPGPAEARHAYERRGQARDEPEAAKFPPAAVGEAVYGPVIGRIQEEKEADIAEVADMEALRRRGLQQPGQRLVAAAEETAGHAEENYLIVERHPGPEGRAQSPDQRGRRPGKSQVNHDALEDFFFSTSAVTPAPTARPTMSAVTVMPRPEPSMVPLIIKSLRVLFAASMAEVAPVV